MSKSYTYDIVDDTVFVYLEEIVDGYIVAIEFDHKRKMPPSMHTAYLAFVAGKYHYPLGRAAYIGNRAMNENRGATDYDSIRDDTARRWEEHFLDHGALRCLQLTVEEESVRRRKDRLRLEKEYGKHCHCRDRENGVHHARCTSTVKRGR